MALDFVKMNGGVSKTPAAKSSGGLDFVKMNEGFADPNAAPVVASASVIKASPREIFTKNPISSDNAMSVAPKANAIAARKIFTANPITAGADQRMSKAPQTTISQGRKPVTFKGAVLDTLASDEFAKTGDALMKVPETAGRVLSLPFEAVAKGAEFVQKGVGAIFNPEIYIGKKSIKTAYQEAPTIGGVISEGIEGANYLLNKDGGEKNQQSVPYQFAKEFTKQLADTGVVAGISMPVLGFAGKKLATKSKTYTLTPENVNGKIIYKEPIPKNVIDVLEKGFKDATPDVITEIQKNGLKITIEAPRGPVGEIPAQLLTGETAKKANIKVEIPNFKGGQVKLGQPQAEVPQATEQSVQATSKPPVAVEPIINQVVYRADSKSVVPETKTFNKVVSFDSQVDAIVNMADSGSEKAQNLIANPNNFTEQAAALLTKTFGNDYDAIQYTNSKEPERGVQYQELSTGNIFSVDKPIVPQAETGLDLGNRKITIEKGAFDGVPITDDKGNLISEPAPKAAELGAYKVGQTIKFDGKEMNIKATLKVGKENKYKLADEKGREIWTNEMGLDSENKAIKPETTTINEFKIGDHVKVVGKNGDVQMGIVKKISGESRDIKGKLRPEGIEIYSNNPPLFGSRIAFKDNIITKTELSADDIKQIKDQLLEEDGGNNYPRTKASLDEVNKFTEKRNTQKEAVQKSVAKPNKLNQALAPVPKIKLTGIENEPKAKYETEILAELDISQAGSRLPIKDDNGYITGYQGIKSTFPSWLPEEFRLNAVIKPVLEAMRNDKTPVKIAEKRLYSYLKEMFDSFDVAEADLGPTLDVADIDFLENKIIKKSYEETKPNAADVSKTGDTKSAPKEVIRQKETSPEKILKPIDKKALDDYEFDNTNELRETERALNDFNTRLLRQEKIDDIITKIGGSYGEVIKYNILDIVNKAKSQLNDTADLQAKADRLPAFSGGSDNANIGVFSDGTPIELGSMNKIRPIEMPEMVRLARQLTGSAPKIKEKMGKKLGYHKGGEIYLKSDQFQKGNEEQTAKLLAHEIGHLVDWLPDRTMARGNLLGRLYSLRGFMKSVFGTETGLFGKQPVNLQKMRNDATREVIKRSNYTYGEYITKKSVREALKPKIKAAYEAAVESSGAIKNSIIKKELMDVSEYWRPYDKVKSSPSYLKYRENPKELYADAISMLLNSPGTLEKKAPTFYREFFAALDNKPDVKADYFELQELLNGSTEKIFAARKEDIRKGFSKAEAIQADFAAKKKLGKQAYWERLRQQLDDINYPILKKQREAEAAGVTFKDEDSPKFVLQEQSMVDNENFLLVENIDKNIVKPIEKAGMTTEDIGEYLMLDRIQKDRADIANPFGFNAKNAGAQLDHMKQLVGEDNFALLQEKAKVFHDLVFKSVEEAVRVGSYNKKLFEEKILPNKDSYASFQVVDYMQDYMPATVKAQVGTLKEVANPFVSTILKTVALNRLNSYQRAKNSTIKMLKENYPDEIVPSKTITDGKISKFKNSKDQNRIEVLEDGKLVGYDVDPYIAKSFEKGGDDLNMIVGLIDKFNNKMFKPLVTTHNLGFALYSNPFRDIQRNYKVIPSRKGFLGDELHVYDVLKAYIKGLPQAIKYSKGELDEFTKSLVESKAINAPINDYNFDPSEDELSRIMERYGVIKKYEPYNNKQAELMRKVVIKTIGQLLERIRFAANTLEIVSKIAGAKIRIAGGESGKDLAYNIRNFTGTPNYKVKGEHTKTTNAIFTFSNIMKEGIKSDFIIATDPKTRSGYWWKTVKINILPKFLMFLASAGYLGSELKKFYDNVSEYEKTNKVVIPLGFRNGKSVSLSVPQDETGRLLSAVFWKMLNFAKEGDAQSLQDIFSLGAGQLPSVSAAVSVPVGWGQYLSGKNPYDSFRGRNVIDDTTFQAGGGPALKKMVEWTSNTLGLSQFTTYDPSKGDSVEVAVQAIPLLNRMIKISDYGQTEKAKKIQSSIKQDVAKDTLKDREAISDYVNKNIDDYKAGKLNIDQAAAEVTADIIGHDIAGQEDLDKMKNIKGKLERALKLGKYDPNFDSIIYATSNKEKAELLKAYREDLSSDEYTKLITQLITEKAISTKVLEMLN